MLCRNLRNAAFQSKGRIRFHSSLSAVASVVCLASSSSLSAATLNATINNAVGLDGSSISGSFTYDPVALTIISSSVVLNNPGLNYTVNLSDTQDSSIIIHTTPAPFAEFVLVPQHPTGVCTEGTNCGTSYVSLTLLSLPSAPGTYPLFTVGNPNTSSDITDDPPNYKGSALGAGATLTISSSGPAAVVLTPPFLQFSSVVNTLPITVTNSGGQNLSITAIPPPIGTNAPDFTIAGSSTCAGGATISPGNSCTIDVTFKPTAPSTDPFDGWEVATLTLYDNASYVPQTVPLSGGGQLVSISPNPVQGSAFDQEVTITGTGFANGAPVNWQGLTMAPWTGTAPQWTGTVTSQPAPSDSITISKNFTPASAIWQIAVVNPGQTSNSSPTRTSNFYLFQVDGTGSASPSLLDDYPFKNAKVDDPDYGLADECTSYVAWRMNRDNGTTDPSNPSFFNKMAGGLWGNANTWAANANFLHYQLEPMTPEPRPQVGDIAQWNEPKGVGHVAYVERVDPNGSIDVSEYNFKLDDGEIKYEYGVRNVSAPGTPQLPFPDAFIHISRLSLNPTSLDFGVVGVGGSSSLDVVVTNSSPQTVSPVAATVGASKASEKFIGDFTPIKDSCAGMSLPPNVLSH
jgi:surface antigen